MFNCLVIDTVEKQNKTTPKTNSRGKWGWRGYEASSNWFQVPQSSFSFVSVFAKQKVFLWDEWMKTLQIKNKALQKRTEILVSKMVEVWDDVLSGWLKKPSSGDEPKGCLFGEHVLQARAAGTGGSGLALLASSRSVGPRFLFWELLCEICKVKGLMGQESQEADSNQEANAVLFSTSLIVPRVEAASFCYAFPLSQLESLVGLRNVIRRT